MGAGTVYGTNMMLDYERRLTGLALELTSFGIRIRRQQQGCHKKRSEPGAGAMQCETKTRSIFASIHPV